MIKYVFIFIVILVLIGRGVGISRQKPALKLSLKPSIVQQKKPQIVIDMDTAQKESCEDDLAINDFMNSIDFTMLSNPDLTSEEQTCITPKYYIVHWSGRWNEGGATDIKNFLDSVELSCQFATDTTQLIAMTNLYPDKVEKAMCSGGASNNITINNEINGVCFDQAIQGMMVPDEIPEQSYLDFNDDLDKICEHFGKNTTEGYDQTYPDTYLRNRKVELEVMTEKAVQNACEVTKQYKIPLENVIGHFNIPRESTQVTKYDPGKLYLVEFKNRLASLQGCF
ncbi:MAG: hypothetical protein ABIO02_01795 [Patescibacteria group bacterium]